MKKLIIIAMWMLIISTSIAFGQSSSSSSSALEKRAQSAFDELDREVEKVYGQEKTSVQNTTPQIKKVIPQTCGKKPSSSLEIKITEMKKGVNINDPFEEMDYIGDLENMLTGNQVNDTIVVRERSRVHLHTLYYKFGNFQKESELTTGGVKEKYSPIGGGKMKVNVDNRWNFVFELCEYKTF